MSTAIANRSLADRALEVLRRTGNPFRNYFARNPWSGYCRAIIAPKVQKFRKTFADRLKKPAA